jgi:hypothetical protein
MGDTGWLILAVAAGLTGALLWVKRELGVMRRRRRRGGR